MISGSSSPLWPKDKVSRDIKAVAFDLDGTIYFGNAIADGAADIIRLFEQSGIAVFYFTNNSMKTRLQLFEKLTGMGLKTDIGHIYNSAYATAVYARDRGVRRVYCVGSGGLREEIRKQGLSVSDEDADIIILGLDTEFDYRKLTAVLQTYVQSRCPIIACNRERTYPVEGGLLMPGCGPLVSAVENACAASVEYVVGKPNTYMMEILSKEWGLDNTGILVVGDSYESDIEMAKRFNCRSILISRENVTGRNYTDTLVVSDISDIATFIMQ